MAAAFSLGMTQVELVPVGRDSSQHVSSSFIYVYPAGLYFRTPKNTHVFRPCTCSYLRSCSSIPPLCQVRGRLGSTTPLRPPRLPA